MHRCVHKRWHQLNLSDNEQQALRTFPTGSDYKFSRLRTRLELNPWPWRSESCKVREVHAWMVHRTGVSAAASLLVIMAGRRILMARHVTSVHLCFCVSIVSACSGHYIGASALCVGVFVFNPKNAQRARKSSLNLHQEELLSEHYGFTHRCLFAFQPCWPFSIHALPYEQFYRYRGRYRVEEHLPNFFLFSNYLVQKGSRSNFYALT